MDELILDKDISFATLLDDEGKVYGYSIFLGGSGDSGVTVTGDTKEDCIKQIVSYLTNCFRED